jgi:hypothetical protein
MLEHTRAAYQKAEREWEARHRAATDDLADVQRLSRHKVRPFAGRRASVLRGCCRCLLHARRENRHCGRRALITVGLAVSAAVGPPSLHDVVQITQLTEVVEESEKEIRTLQNVVREQAQLASERLQGQREAEAALQVRRTPQ